MKRVYHQHGYTMMFCCGKRPSVHKHLKSTVREGVANIFLRCLICQNVHEVEYSEEEYFAISGIGDLMEDCDDTLTSHKT